MFIGMFIGLFLSGIIFYIVCCSVRRKMECPMSEHKSFFLLSGKPCDYEITNVKKWALGKYEFHSVCKNCGNDIYSFAVTKKEMMRMGVSKNELDSL